MNLTFEDAEPITSKSNKTAEPNPFTEAVAAIAWKTAANGKPLTRATKVPLTDDKPETVKALEGKIGRWLTSAGDALTKPGTVRRSFTVVNEGEDHFLRVAFSVTAKQRRERKTNTPA